MVKSSKTTTKKVAKKAPAKKVRIVVKKPDFSKLKEINFKPIGKIVGLILILVSIFALIDLAVQYLNNDYSVAVIEGTRISKSKWHKALEKQYGSSVAQKLIQDQIIREEAKKAKITASKEDIDSKIKEYEDNLGGKEALEAALKANNISIEDLREVVELEVLLTKLLTPEIKYTDDDLKKFFTQYSQEYFPKESSELEPGEKLDFEQYKDKVEDLYVRQQILSRAGSWITEAEAKYRIQDNTVSKPSYGFLTTSVNIINNLLETTKKDK